MAKPVFFDRSGATSYSLRPIIRIFPGRCPMQVRCSNESRCCEGNCNLVVPAVTNIDF